MGIGNALKEARMKSNYTQIQVAEKLYVPRQTISRWEQNKTIPNIYVLNS